MIAFLIYITVRNQLPDYLALFTSSKIIGESKVNTNETNPYTERLNKTINDIFSQAGLV